MSGRSTSLLRRIGLTTRAAATVFGAASAPSDRERSTKSVSLARSRDFILSAAASEGRMPV